MEFLQSTSGILTISIVVIAVSLYAVHEIIKSATYSKENTQQQKLQSRLMMMKMRKEGFSKEAIAKAISDTDGDFWDSL